MSNKGNTNKRIDKMKTLGIEREPLCAYIFNVNTAFEYELKRRHLLIDGKIMMLSLKDDDIEGIPSDLALAYRNAYRFNKEQDTPQSQAELKSTKNDIVDHMLSELAKKRGDISTYSDESLGLERTQEFYREHFADEDNMFILS